MAISTGMPNRPNSTYDGTPSFLICGVAARSAVPVAGYGTVSFGIRQIGPSDRPDLGARCTTSDRDAPYNTSTSGPLMARGLMAPEAVGLVAGFTVNNP